MSFFLFGGYVKIKIHSNLFFLKICVSFPENVSRENELSLLADEGIEYDEEDLIITKSGLCKKVKMK